MPTVADPSSAVLKMRGEWLLIEDLMGGTDAMRVATTRHLPKWPGESPESYEARLQSSTLFPGLKRTVVTLAAKPFSKPLTYSDDVPERIKTWCQEDCDMQGRDLHTFTHEAMEVAVGPGLGGILTDFPEGAPAKTVAEEQAAGRRPYFVLIKPGQILGWRVEVGGGKVRLTMLRFTEDVEVPDGEYATKCITQVRVFVPGKWETWRKIEGKNGEAAEDWVKFAEGAITNVKEIPFAPFYGERLGFMRAKPPLLELAHMNVEHWQSASDQRVIMHVARVPILVALGIEDKNFSVTVGASGCVVLPEKDMDLKYVEHTGAAITAGADDLKNLEERMRQAGAELLIPRPNDTTAFQVASENAIGASLLQTIALGVEDAVDLSLEFMAQYVGEAKGGNVTLFNDWAALNLAEASMADLIKMEAAGVISKETLFEEAQRRSIISPDREFADEADRIDEQGPPLGSLGVDPITGEPILPKPGAKPPGAPGKPPMPGAKRPPGFGNGAPPKA